jgi:hypothetical protein
VECRVSILIKFLEKTCRNVLIYGFCKYEVTCKFDHPVNCYYLQKKPEAADDQSTSNQDLTPLSKPEFVPQSAKEFVPQSAKEFVPQSAKEFVPQSAQEFVPQSAQEFVPQSAQEFYPQNVDAADQGYDEYYDQMDGYMNNMSLEEQPMTNTQRLDAYFYNRQQQQPYPRQVVSFGLLINPRRVLKTPSAVYFIGLVEKK